jgi:hypothetical protein
VNEHKKNLNGPITSFLLFFSQRSFHPRLQQTMPTDRERTHAKFYQEYKYLAGRDNKKDYMRKLEGFLSYTQDIYCGGECTVVKRVNGEEILIDSRDMSMELFARDFCGGDAFEASLIFTSVDRVHAYS